MIHVDQQDTVEAARRQAGIGGRTELDADIVEPLARDALGELVAHRGDDVLGEDAPARTDAAGEADRVIAFAGADVRDGHAGGDLRAVHYLARLVAAVARVLGRPARRDDRRDRTRGGGEHAAGDARVRLLRGRAAGGEGEDGHQPHPLALSLSKSFPYAEEKGGL